MTLLHIIASLPMDPLRYAGRAAPAETVIRIFIWTIVPFILMVGLVEVGAIASMRIAAIAVLILSFVGVIPVMVRRFRDIGYPVLAYPAILLITLFLSLYFENIGLFVFVHACLVFMPSGVAKKKSAA